MQKKSLSPEQVRVICDPGWLNFDTTADVPPIEGIIGQDRAARAIEFGLQIDQDGYNIYVSGIPGSGRTTSVESAVREIAKKRPVPDDWCYVYNFKEPDSPKCLRFPPGKAVIFRDDMETFVEELKIELPKAFEGKAYDEQKNLIIRKFQKEKEEIIREIEERAKNASFALKRASSGFVFVPLVEGKPLTDEDMEKLTEESRKEIKMKEEILVSELSEAFRKIRQADRSLREEIQKIEYETTLFTVSPRINELKEKYAEFPDVIEYLEEVQRDIIENPSEFEEKKDIEILPGLKSPVKENNLFKYKVNVFIDNSKTQGAPVVRETQSTYYNLTGRIEYRPALGAMLTDFTMIKPGALHKANGGYLILHILDVLRNYYAWEALKRTIKNKDIRIEDINEQFRIINTPTLKPQPIPANVKIILIGSPMIYYILYTYDEDFEKLFKVRADFSSIMDRDIEGVRQYAEFISRRVKEDKLKEFDKNAVAKIVEYGSRIVEDQKKLSTRFMEITDLLREANHWANIDSSEIVRQQHVQKAIEEKIYRSNLIEKRIEELMKDGIIMVDTDGEAVGQVNGLSVLSLGDYQFGKPSRITASVSIGKGGPIHIDREVKMSGTIHNKGFLILKGLFAEKFGRNFPLSFSATLCFEQVYEEIEGDSASSTEYYGLISGISEIPIKQGIAVTGSINQKGEVQPIGGVNEKIEGYYSICKIMGLTGNQGVIIPEKNSTHLMLKEEVVQAIQDGKFNVWAVKDVDEGIEILTGMPAGKIQEDGTYPEGTVNYVVSQKLMELARRAKELEKKLKVADDSGKTSNLS
ncbi:MAG: Lon protease [candidate division TA06 bacterium ADurb.Bin131]|uniref:endopeptidase La n=1 Tax=candidate division TA06 bacterium ADurb.Bin131 TaxID=1852827 RepID=A0A1V6C8P4_UNCT6|nr:MAG: Lon protease [candidate division TA06 bacterium ADurb.Bin131]